MLTRVSGAKGEGAFASAPDIDYTVVVVEGLLCGGLAGCGESERVSVGGRCVHRRRYLLRVVGLLRTESLTGCTPPPNSDLESKYCIS
jgi:hypothetical protein